MVHDGNPSTREAEVGGLWVWGQVGLHGETLSFIYMYTYICYGEKYFLHFTPNKFCIWQFSK
jgi:hypothetical protein